MRTGWRTVLAALAAVLVNAGLTSAQTIPQPMPKQLPNSAVQHAAPQASSTVDLRLIQTQGCATGNCGGATTAPVATPVQAAPASPSLVHRFLSPFTIGPGCNGPVGQTCWARDRTFYFGSSKQFFNPGYKCGSHCGNDHWNNCGYFSYADR